MLTLIVVVLIISCPVKHSKDLKDVAIAVVAMELVPRAIKAKDKLARLPPKL